MKKPSLRIHFRRICSDSDSVSPMPSAGRSRPVCAGADEVLPRRRVAYFRGICTLAAVTRETFRRSREDLRSCHPLGLPTCGA